MPPRRHLAPRCRAGRRAGRLAAGLVTTGLLIAATGVPVTAPGRADVGVTAGTAAGGAVHPGTPGLTGHGANGHGANRHGAAALAGEAARTGTGRQADHHRLRAVAIAPAAPSVVGATVTGPAAGATPMILQVDLAPRHAASLASLARAVADPSSPRFRHFLSVAGFRHRFGASAVAVAAVRAQLAAAGLRVSAAAADGLALTVTGHAAQVAAALHVRVVSVRTASGATVAGATAAPQLPAAVAGAVTDVQGLAPWVTATAAGTPAGTPALAGFTGAAPAVSGTPSAPAACSSITDMSGALTPAQMAADYGINRFWAGSTLGQGATVGVIEFDGFSTADISSYESCTGESVPVTVDAASGASLPGTASPEPTGDIETLIGLLPGASDIVSYEDTNGTGFGPVMTMAVTSTPLPRVISISWGICDALMGPSAEASDNTVFEEAAVQGQTVVASSGDSGAEGCGSSYPSTVSASFPASSPWVLGVGGTGYSGSQATVWNDTGGTIGASGGGLDPYTATQGLGGSGQPTWQTAPGTTAYQGSGWCTAAGGCRAVPDVSAIAQAVYPLYCTYGACGSGGGWVSGWQLVGGTSMAAPSWAAALTLAGQQCGTSLGSVDPLLYQLADAGQLPLGTVAAGTNAWGGQGPAGVFTSTGTGYSPVTGLGALGEGGPSLAGGQLCAPPAAVPADRLSTTSLVIGPIAPGATATATVTVTNTASVPMTVTGATVAGSAYGTGSPFGVGIDACGTVGGGASTVAAGGTCTLTISFTGATAGTYHDTLAIDDNAFGTVQQVALTGTVEAAGTLSLSTTSLPFGQVQQDTNRHQVSVVLTDTSASLPVPNLGVTLSPSSSSLAHAPVLTDGCGTSLAAGATCTASVVLDSNQAPGSWSGTLAVSAAAANTTGASLPVSATLTAAAEAATASPDPVAVPGLAAGATGVVTVTVSNASASYALGLGSLAAAGTDAASLALASDTCSGAVVAVGGTCTVAVHVTEPATGSLSADLLVPIADGTAMTVPVTASAPGSGGSGGSGSGAGSGPTSGSTPGSSGGSGTSSSGTSSSGGASGIGGAPAGGSGTGSSTGSRGTSHTPGTPPTATRVAGQTADETAVAVSQSLFPTPGSAAAVVLARDDYFADALAGGPLAAAVGGPLLITPGASTATVLAPEVLAEIQRVLPLGRTVYVLGGPLALSPGIDTELQQAGYVVQRVEGQTEFGTAVAVATLLGDPATIFEATGLNFADALSAVPAAVAAHGAILLTDGSTQAPETAAYLAQHPPAVRYAIGGPLAAAGADPAAIAVYGQDQFGTAAAVASRFFPGATGVGVATATTFSDALAGGVAMAHQGGPMLLVPSSGVPTTIAAYLQGDAAQLATVTVFGGPLAVSDSELSSVLAGT